MRCAQFLFVRNIWAPAASIIISERYCFAFGLPDEQWKGYQKSDSLSKGSPKKLVKQSNVIDSDSAFEALKSEDGIKKPEDGAKSVGFA